MEYQLITPKVPVEKQKLSLVEQVFLNRGFTLEEMDHYLHLTWDDVCAPSLLDNIDRAAVMLLQHLVAGDQIFIQVDADCDGFSSAAALINYLNMIAPGHAQHSILYRLHEDKQHGIIPSTVPKDVKLVIAPDSSSSDYDQHKELMEQGIDVLVLDHHLAPKVSEYACVVNNQLCDYPTKSLSGVGIVYKLCQYIDSKLGDSQYSNDILDLVALGMIADVMSLKDYETKFLISQGINNIRNPFIAQMVKNQAFSLGEELTPMGIAFYIAPYVNAAVRVGNMEDKILLFESMLEFKAYEEVESDKRGCKGQTETKVEQACRHCANIKSRQTKTRDTSLEIIRQTIEEKHLLDLPVLIIQLDSYIDHNIVGLVANEIAGQYQRPTAILNKYTEDGNIVWKGSCRNGQFSKLTNFKDFMSDSGLVRLAAGHQSAFGLEVLDSKMADLKAYVKDKLENFDFSSCYYVDFIWQFRELKDYADDIIDLSSYKSCWGQDVSEPYIAIEQVRVTKNNIVLMSPDKRPTIKIMCDNGVNLIKFRSSKEEFETLCPDSDLGCVIINIIGTCERNVWNGNINPQILIKDYAIMGVQSYYF